MRQSGHTLELSEAREERSLEIVVRDLHRAFGDRDVLDGIDLAIHCGEIVAIVGASGCGKTVLLRHMIGSLVPDRGRVLIADHEEDGAPLMDLGRVTDEGMDHVRTHWAVVFQRNALFTGTVYENIALWLREIRRMPEAEIERKVRRSLAAVELDVEDVRDKDRDELSGGMAKRVAIARAIAMDPLLIFYDEPTTGLDPSLSGEIHELISTVHLRPPFPGAHRTTVIITHDKDLLRRLMPRIVMLHEGRVIFDGAYEAFARADSPLVRPYFEAMPVLQRQRA